MKIILALSVGLLAPTCFSSTEDNSLSFSTENRISLDSSGSSGWYFVPEIGFNIISNTATEGHTIEFSDGLSIGGGFGVELDTDLAFQFDFAYIKNDVDLITNDSTDVASNPNIEFTQTPIMFNLIWTPTNQPDLRPYFGLGAGASRGKFDSNTFISSDAEWAFAGQVRVGMEIDLSPQSSVSIGYKFTLAQYDDNIDNHTIGLGLQFRF
ncbi:MAG: outer membrane beta-barrel protein [Phycisphaerales bacterium]|jgi:opacity protein-like surface antigen|nr:outer membrane beta-barrel protein [Phycisphaerales bacterium]